MKRLSLTLFALIALIFAVILLPSCAATGFGRKAPVAVEQKGKLASLLWSAANCPDEWDKSLSPLDPPGLKDEQARWSEGDEIRYSHMTNILGRPSPSEMSRKFKALYVQD